MRVMRNLAGIVDLLATEPSVNKAQLLEFMYLLSICGCLVITEDEYKELEEDAERWRNRPQDNGLTTEFIK